MKKYIILIPLYNDWKSAFKLLENIDSSILNLNVEVSVLIVNDASTEKRPVLDFKFKKIKSLRVLNMEHNRGHARCYATGLKYLTEKEKFDYIIQMDADGEDRPEELSVLFDKSTENPFKTITLNRKKRSEGLFFKFLYESHKILTYFFTGNIIKFGNYCCLPRNDVIKLLAEACIWSSFSGSLTKVISERISIPSIRGKRYFGPSQMNLFSLLHHSFAIIAVFKKTVIVRSIFYLSVYLFFISSNFSFITLFPVLIIIIFLILILKISLRANIDELNNSLKNIVNVDILSNLNSR